MQHLADARPQVISISSLIVSLMVLAGCGQHVDVSALPALEGDTRSYTFSANDVGREPAGWKVEQTGKGEGSTWKVTSDSTAPSGAGYVLTQVAESPRSVFNLCVLQEGQYADLRLSVALKPIAGQGDQGGGLVWRYVDANNYYICRMNPLESNLRIYKVIAGSRKQLASVDVALAVGEWQTLTASMKDDLIVCAIGNVLVAVRDNTLKAGGHIGLWTKGDAHTRFDSFSVTAPNISN